jgi:hypothetical protein
VQCKHYSTLHTWLTRTRRASAFAPSLTLWTSSFDSIMCRTTHKHVTIIVQCKHYYTTHMTNMDASGLRFRTELDSMNEFIRHYNVPPHLQEAMQNCLHSLFDVRIVRGCVSVFFVLSVCVCVCRTFGRRCKTVCTILLMDVYCKWHTVWCFIALCFARADLTPKILILNLTMKCHLFRTNADAPWHWWHWYGPCNAVVSALVAHRRAHVSLCKY